MENKPQNVFEKLDRQEEKIEDISSKLEGISIEDLYALAKRTWDYEDYQTAQKYYNHISLLRPLDWEAPLYASLCNFKGSHRIDFWEYGLEKVSKVFVSTLNYINNMNKQIDDKEIEMTKCVEILKNFMLAIKDMYFKNKAAFDVHVPNFVYNIEIFYFEVYSETKYIELNSLNHLRVFVADNILDLVKTTSKLSSEITKEDFDELIQLSDTEYDLNYSSIIVLNSVKSKNQLSDEEKKEIKLNGVMYFEYNDKIIAKRNFNRNIIIGLLLLIISIAGIVVSFLGDWYWMFAFVFSIFYGVLLVTKAVTQKDRIKCASLLSVDRVKNRLTSDGNITQDKKFNFMMFITIVGLCLVPFVGMYMGIFAITGKDITIFTIVFVIIDAVNIIICFTSIKGIFEHHSRFNGKYTYFFKGKYYNL